MEQLIELLQQIQDLAGAGIDALKGAGLAGWMPTQLANLPLSEQGLAWLVPSLMTLVVAVVIDRMLGKRSEAIA